jgi:hypothetical protein
LSATVSKLEHAALTKGTTMMQVVTSEIQLDSLTFDTVPAHIANIKSGIYDV